MKEYFEQNDKMMFLDGCWDDKWVEINFRTNDRAGGLMELGAGRGPSIRWISIRFGNDRFTFRFSLYFIFFFVGYFPLQGPFFYFSPVWARARWMAVTLSHPERVGNQPRSSRAQKGISQSALRVFHWLRFHLNALSCKIVNNKLKGALTENWKNLKN